MEENSPRAIIMAMTVPLRCIVQYLTLPCLLSKGKRTNICCEVSIILHNDIISDNVVVETANNSVVDLGKACYQSDGRRYDLSKEEKKKYLKHPQISPDLRDGLCSQSFATDIYSVGRVLNEVNRLVIELSAVNSLSIMCKEYSSSKRPSTNDLYTSLTFLLSP
jgi:serine/threonine protein kinase